jgi:hypothetical protein
MRPVAPLGLVVGPHVSMLVCVELYIDRQGERQCISAIV